MTQRLKRYASGGAVLMMALLVAIAMGAAPAAATSHTQSLAGDGTDTVTSFNASEDQYLTYTLNSDDGTNGFGSSGDGSTVLYFNVTESGEEHELVSNSSFGGSSTSHTFNISHADLDTVPGDANGSTTVTMNAWGENDSGAVTTSVDTFDVTIEYQDGYAVVYVGDTEMAGDNADVSASAEEPSGFFSFADSPTYNVEADNVGLGGNASGTTVHIVAANQSDSSAFSEADSELWGSNEAGDFHDDHLLTIEGHTHAVFAEEAPEAVADDYTYGTVGTRGGHDAYTVHIDEDYSGESTLDISTTANDGPTVAFLVKRDAYSSTLDAFTASTAGAAGTGLTAG